MIPGFEDMTHEVSQDEINMSYSIAKAFNLRIGKKNAISASQIIRSYEINTGVKLNAGRLRKIIQYIRLHNMSPKLVSSQKGYYIAQTEDELNNWIESMNKRIRQTQYTLACAVYFSGQGDEYKQI